MIGCYLLYCIMQYTCMVSIFMHYVSPLIHSGFSLSLSFVTHLCVYVYVRVCSLDSDKLCCFGSVL
uniref:Uncharacterized protein n=1 Tax=Anguilla anguilla TaxID=7936 RepID=A0A0E9UZP5_ANGAN